MLKRYIAQGSVIHDQEPYQAGDPIMLEDNQATPLLAIGRVKLDDTRPVETLTLSADTPQTTPAAGLDPASLHTMTSQQTGEPMTAAPSGAQIGPDQPLPPAPTTPEPKPAADQPAASQSAPTAPQTTTAGTQPTPEQIAQDMAEL